MLQIYNETETELICKIIDSTGKFYALFRDDNYYGSFLIISDDNSKDILAITRLVYQDEGASCFFIDMKNYLDNSDSYPIKVIHGKQYVLAVRSDGGKFEDNYNDCEDDPDEKNIFEYFYPSQHINNVISTQEEHLAAIERCTTKQFEKRMKSKGMDCLELPTQGIFYGTMPTIKPLTKKEIEVDLAFINEI